MPRLKQTFNRIVLGVLTLTVSVLVSGAAFGQKSKGSNFQGILRDGSGNPVPNGTYSITFKIYKVPTGGPDIWTQTGSITTTNGLFSTSFGPVPQSVLWNGTKADTMDRYLGITIAPDPEMSPRHALQSSPYSGVTLRMKGDASTYGDADSSIFRLQSEEQNTGRIELANRSTGQFMGIVDQNGDTAYSLSSENTCSPILKPGGVFSPQAAISTSRSNIKAKLRAVETRTSSDCGTAGSSGITFTEPNGDTLISIGTVAAQGDPLKDIDISLGKKPGGISLKVEDTTKNGLYFQSPNGDTMVSIMVEKRQGDPIRDVGVSLGKKPRSISFKVNGSGSVLSLADSTGIPRINITTIGRPKISGAELEAGGAIATPVAVVTSNITLTSAHSIVLGNASGGLFTITLPAANTCAGRSYTIKKIDATGNGAVVVGVTGFDLIDGTSVYALNSQFDFVAVVSDGVNRWYTVAK
jgi:hypothetical protein